MPHDEAYFPSSRHTVRSRFLMKSILRTFNLSFSTDYEEHFHQNASNRSERTSVMRYPGYSSIKNKAMHNKAKDVDTRLTLDHLNGCSSGPSMCRCSEIPT